MGIAVLGALRVADLALGGRIKDARERRGWSQYALARAADVTPAAISRIEAGKAEPTLESASKIAHALDLTTSELIGERETIALSEPPEMSLARRASPDLAALKMGDALAFLAALASLPLEDQQTVEDLVFARAARHRAAAPRPPIILGSPPENH